ncbi:hypothetical protein Ahy_B04g069357 [Arachis hypogaea]|uniref:Uncharacterized protein n=1 Tax=Arachis hypogaea TaxID=3818 RepID=A0A444ZCM4_ARAHY|nr:hypothetical protein Ahy_B04g069357 [Arachis hypogaea]
MTLSILATVKFTTQMEGFRNSRDAVLLAVKNYSIRRNVEYRVLGSDRPKYHSRCKQFSAGCP